MFGLFKKKPPKSKNDAVRNSLRKYGDDGTRVRHVIHFAYQRQEGEGATQDEARRAVLGILAVEFTETAESTGIVFEHYREVASSDFDALTDRLEAELKALDWSYDGWECAVETGE